MSRRALLPDVLTTTKPGSPSAIGQMSTVSVWLVGILVTLLVVLVGVVFYSTNEMDGADTHGTVSDAFSAMFGGPSLPTTDPDPSLPDFCTAEARLSRVRTECRHQETTGDKRSFFYRRLLVDDTHRVLYCVVPFVGSTSLKRTLAQAALNAQNKTAEKHGVLDTAYLNSVGLRFLDDYDMDTIKDKLDGYYKVIAVMDPVKRMNVTYERAFRNGYTTKLHGQIIRKRFKNLKKHQDDRFYLSFSEFLTLVTEESGFKDLRWAPIYDICHPCDISYDKIIKMESFWEDVLPLLERLTDSLGFTPPLFESLDRAEVDRAQHAVTSLNDVSLKVVDAFLRRYRHDMTLFGYSWSYVYGSECLHGGLSDELCC